MRRGGRRGEEKEERFEKEIRKCPVGDVGGALLESLWRGGRGSKGGRGGEVDAL